MNSHFVDAHTLMMHRLTPYPLFVLGFTDTRSSFLSLKTGTFLVASLKANPLYSKFIYLETLNGSYYLY